MSLVKRLTLRFNIAVLACFILIFSPTFIYLFGTLNSFAFQALFLIVCFYFLMEEKYGLALMAVTAFLCSSPIIFASTPKNNEEAPGRILAKQAVKNSKRWTTTDHAKIDALKQNAL